MTPAARDRAISDIVGFVLTVGIILIGVGVVATVGVDQIQGFQGTQNIENAERAMTVLDGNLDELQESRATVLSSQLAVHNARLATNDARGGTSNLSVDVLGDGDPTVNDYPMRTVSYRTDDTRVVYEGGAVLLDNAEGESISLRDSSFVCTDDRAVVSFVTIAVDDVGEGYGGGTAAITTSLNETRVHYPDARSGAGSLSSSDGVAVTVDSNQSAAWRDSLTANGWTNPSGSTFECVPPAGGPMPVFVRQTVVDVELQ